MAPTLAAALLLPLLAGPCGGESPPRPSVIWPDVDSIQRFRPTSCGARCKSKAPADRLAGLCGGGPLEDSDLATFWVSALLRGFRGRSDLDDLRVMGVRAMQLHRCVVNQTDFKDFLDKAWVDGLSVVIELPSRLYLDSSSGCFSRDFNCYYVVRRLYRQLLATAVSEDGEYHPAIRLILLARDPDLLTPAYCAGEDCARQGAFRAVVTAWDGLLDAESELGVSPGRTPQQTVRAAALFSTAALPSNETEPTCHYLTVASGGCPGTDVLRGLWLAMRHAPGSARTGEGLGNVVFAPHNDLEAVLPTRWLHTFGAESGQADVVRTLRDYYSFITPTVPRDSEVGLGSQAIAALLEFNESTAR